MAYIGMCSSDPAYFEDWHGETQKVSENAAIELCEGTKVESTRATVIHMKAWFKPDYTSQMQFSANNNTIRRKTQHYLA